LVNLCCQLTGRLNLCALAEICVRISIHSAEQPQANRHWPRRLCKHRQCITSALPLILDSLQLLNKPAQLRPATRARCVASAMAASVLNKLYRFILVSDLDWTMVSISVYGSALSGSQFPGLGRRVLPIPCIRCRRAG